MRPAKYSESVVMERPVDRNLATLGMKNYSCADTCPDFDESQSALLRADQIANVSDEALRQGLPEAFLTPTDIGKIAIGLRNNGYLYRSKVQEDNDGIYTVNTGQSANYAALLKDIYLRLQARRFVRTCTRSGIAMQARHELSRYEMQ